MTGLRADPDVPGLAILKHIPAIVPVPVERAA